MFLSLFPLSPLLLSFSDLLKARACLQLPILADRDDLAVAVYSRETQSHRCFAECPAPSSIPSIRGYSKFFVNPCMPRFPISIQPVFYEGEGSSLDLPFAIKDSFGWSQYLFLPEVSSQWTPKTYSIHGADFSQAVTRNWLVWALECICLLFLFMKI